VVREQLNELARRVDVQMLTNRGEWIFEGVHGQKIVALAVVQLGKHDALGCRYVFRPEQHSFDRFRVRRLDDLAERDAPWLRSYSSAWVQPTLPTGPAAMSLSVLERMMQSPRMSSHPVFRARRVYADVETTRDKGIYGAGAGERDVWPVYGGDSFDIWRPDTGTYYALTTRAQALEVVQRKRVNSPSTSPYGAMPRSWREDQESHPSLAPRIAFRNVTNRTNLRTLLAALVPAGRIMVETAPWVLWLSPEKPVRQEAFLLGVMSSITADWWMRCYAESHIEGGAFDALPVPVTDLDSGSGSRAVARAGRLACLDDRFAEWAKSVGVSHGPLKSDEKQAKIEELDAIVAHLFGLTPDHLIHIFETFHEWTDESQAKVWAARRDRTVAMLRGLE
jgi:hypothetical protein